MKAGRCIIVKRYVMICSLACLVMSSLSGCSSKDEESNLKSQKEQTPANHQTQDESQRNESAKGTEDSEPKMATANYAEAFQSISGCAVIFNEAGNVYTFYNEEECKTQVSPCSTFKIISTLMGLHNQVVTSEESRMYYNGTNYPLEAWNADLGLADAFQNSCVWYFRQIIDQVGQEEVQKELTALNYGNCDTTKWEGSNTNPLPELNGFWLDSSLKISPLEQVEILRNIIEGRTIYTQEEVDVLKRMMLIEENGTEKIYGKTGTGKNGTAWFTGFEENQDANIYVAIYLNDNDSNEVNGAKAKEIALHILNE